VYPQNRVVIPRELAHAKERVIHATAAETASLPLAGDCTTITLQ